MSSCVLPKVECPRYLADWMSLPYQVLSAHCSDLAKREEIESAHPPGAIVQIVWN